ncbi:MAG TPA: hypothetical protein VF698_03550, partial [Thermoanaerobaculia bacterium]
AGGLVEPDRDPADSRLPMMDRIINVLMGGLRDYQLLSAGATAVGSSSDPRKVHFHMTDELQDETGEAPRNAMARIRTDLDAFNDIEIQLLIRRGYLLAQQKVRPKVFHAKSPFRTLAKPTRNTPPAAPRMNDHVLRILRGSARQSGRLAEAYPVIAATLAMLTILLLVGEADRGVRPPLRRSQKVAEHEHRFTRIDRELHAARGRR